MMGEMVSKWKCKLCGRIMAKKSPHYCNSNFRKRHIIWEEIEPIPSQDAEKDKRRPGKSRLVYDSKKKTIFKIKGKRKIDTGLTLIDE